MILSRSEEEGEYQLVRKPEHFSRVQQSLREHVSGYFDRWLDSCGEAAIASELASKFNVKADVRTLRRRTLISLRDRAREQFEKERNAYQQFFAPETLEDYHDGGANAFRDALTKQVPIIRHCFRSSSPRLNDWKIKFRAQDPRALLTTFENLVDFSAEWKQTYGADHLVRCTTSEDVGFDKLDDDKTLYILGVIGVGIKSTVLYHLDPACFPLRDRFSMYGMYFLTGKHHFNTPTRSSEFLMIVDKELDIRDGLLQSNHRMEHNFWYPYGLFTLHAMQVWSVLRDRARALDVPLDEPHRFLWVRAFLEGVKDLHPEDVKTLLGQDEWLP